MNISNKVFVTIFLLFMIILPSICLGQAEHTNLLKYWYYRDRLKYFVIPGNKMGESEVASIRNSNLFANIDFGQHSCYTGYYFGVLATEIRMLLNNGNTQAALAAHDELVKAVLEYIYSMDYCEWYWPPYAGTDSDFNGFFIRTGVPRKFLSDDPNSPDWDFGSTEDGISHVSLLNLRIPDNAWYIDNIHQFYNLPRGHPGYLFNDNNNPGSHIQSDIDPENDGEGKEEMSQDEAIGLLLGLALIYRFVPDDNEVLPYTLTNLRQSSAIIATKIVDYIHDGTIGCSGDWIIRNPLGDEVSQGGNAYLYAYGFARAATYFDVRILDDYFAGDDDRDAARLAWNTTQNENVGYTEYVGNAVMESTLAAIGDSWFKQICYIPPIWGNNNTYDCIALKMRVYNIDPFYLLLYYTLHSWDVSLDETTQEKISDILDDAPGEGPYFYTSDYNADCGWAYTYRWHGWNWEQWGWPTPSGEYRTPGNYNGLDYMLLFNMWNLFHNPVNPDYHPYDNWQTSGNLPILLPDNTILGDNDHPMNIAAFERLESTGHILNTTRFNSQQDPISPLPYPAKINYFSQQSIQLKPGFVVERGANFKAIVKTVYWLDFNQGISANSECKFCEHLLNWPCNPPPDIDGAQGTESMTPYLSDKTMDKSVSTNGIKSGIDTAQSIQNDIEVFPNPVVSKLNIKISKYNGQILHVKIFNSSSTKLVYEGEFDSQINTVDLSQFTPGLYYITIIGNNTYYNGKFVKI